MIRIKTRDDLLGFIESNLPVKYVTRAILDGEVEVLGAFERTPGHPTSPGWIVRVTSNTGKSWAVSVFVGARKVRVMVLQDEIPWEHWIGEGLSVPIFRGDNPRVYKELRKNAETKKR